MCLFSQCRFPKPRIYVRHHRVVTHGSAGHGARCPSPCAFSSGPHRLAPLQNGHQSDPVVCWRETSWKHCLTPPTPSGRFPLRHRSGRRPRWLCKPMCALCTTRSSSCMTVWRPWRLGCSRIPRLPPSHRHRTRRIRSLACARPQPRLAKQAGNWGIQTIARCSYPRRPCARCDPSGVRVGT